MDFLQAGVPVGRFWGITVRLHFTFFIFAFWQAQRFRSFGYGLAFVAGLYICILLHEFGHALAARWCDGEADNILLWPLGGLAFVRPAFHPTAALITTVAGPFVTLVLWMMFWGLVVGLVNMSALAAHTPYVVVKFVNDMRQLNRWLLLFNMIPAFPMDAGRIVRDVLWYWLGAERATTIAVMLSRVIAIAGGAWALYSGNYWLILLVLFILSSSMSVEQIIAAEMNAHTSFSIRERLRRGRRARAFHKGVGQRRTREETSAFHTCVVCGRTDQEDPDLDFRVCPDCTRGQEYCQEHLEGHQHA